MGTPAMAIRIERAACYKHSCRNNSNTNATTTTTTTTTNHHHHHNNSSNNNHVDNGNNNDSNQNNKNDNGQMTCNARQCVTIARCQTACEAAWGGAKAAPS